jgi:ubiquinone/menaquinone biosynthesis C-methylase UbiE
VEKPGDFWNALAPYHWRIENSYLKPSVVRHFIREVRGPVLVVGAGQGLIVEELQEHGLACVGIDLCKEMVRQARRRRGLTLVRADATALPFASGSFETVIFATGVIDFIADDRAIASMLREARQVSSPTGKVLVAFYRISASSEAFLTRLGLLRDGTLCYRELLESYRLRPAQVLAWIAAKAGVSRPNAALLALRCWALTTLEEKRNAVSLQRVFADPEAATHLVDSAPVEQPYRDSAAIHALFKRLDCPTDWVAAFPNCRVVAL